MKDKEIKMKLAQSFNSDQAKLLQEMLNNPVDIMKKYDNKGYKYV